MRYISNKGMAAILGGTTLTAYYSITGNAELAAMSGAATVLLGYTIIKGDRDAKKPFKIYKQPRIAPN